MNILVRLLRSIESDAVGQNVGNVYCCSGVVQINAAHSELFFALGIFVADWLEAFQWWRIMPQARGL
ncbi:hypothetical protein [Pseudomonas sp. PM2]|jgi:hypothetical protein|uniref:hypothetical protein n=1 Tax=Pseudomonas sp. PM2 TaxID=215172 RepID=UPI003FA1BE34